VIAGHEVSEQQFLDALTTAGMKYFGQIGFASMEARLIRFNHETCEAIVACQRDKAHDFLTVLSLVTETSGSPLAFLVVVTSGTIRSLMKKRRASNVFHSASSSKTRG
jgi:RNase P/RNase MRP subunit POP5